MITHDVREAVFLSQRIYVLSTRPGTVKQEFKIELPGDRTLDSRYNGTADFGYEDSHASRFEKEASFSKADAPKRALGNPHNALSRNYQIKRHPSFHQQADQILDLLRSI